MSGGTRHVWKAQRRASARLLIFWDYDTQWGADRSRTAGGPKSWGEQEFACTERLLELHAEYAVPACFAVVGAAALPGARPYHDPAQIRRIHAAGHEIASHSFRHEWLPGLAPAALRATLSQSKAALEQCVGAEVSSFVPPFNQPFDYARAGSFSLSERRSAGPARIDLAQLCAALVEVGYRFCRVAYRPLAQRLAELLVRRRLDRPVHVEMLAGLCCVRLNTPGGFDAPTLAGLELAVRRGGIVVAYGHPHSLHAGNSQDERWLVPLLQRVRALREAGLLTICQPRQLLPSFVQAR